MEDLAAKPYHEINTEQDIEHSLGQLRDYVRGGVRDAFSMDLGTLHRLSDKDIRSTIAQLFYNSWQIFVAQGE